MNRLSLLVPVIASMLVMAATSWGQAVSVDAESLVQRLDAIEKRLSVAEGRRSSASSGSANIGGLSGYTAADLEQRMTTLEEDSSKLRGSTDRSLMAIERLAKRFDDYIKDLDMRLSDIETRMETLSAPAAAPAVATPAAESGEVVAESQPAAKSAAPKAAIPADMSAADHYNKAYAYLTATDYKNAEVWFEDFLKRHPNDALADNAYYWLGEVYLVQNNPKAAAVKFRDGLKAFPKGGKAAANLFKMGVALEQLKQPKLARAAWTKLQKDFPKSPEAARAKDKLLALPAE